MGRESGEQGERWNVEKTTNTKDLLKIRVEACYCRSILKYIHVRKDFQQSHHTMGETMPQPDISCHRVKPPVPGIGCILLSHQLKQSHAAPSTQISQDIAKAVGCSLQTDGSSSIVEDTYIIEHEKNQAETRSLPPTNQFMVLSGTLHTTREERQLSISPRFTPFDLQQQPACKINWYNGDANFMGVTNHFWLDLRPDL